MNREYCEFCNEEVDCKIVTTKIKRVVDNLIIEYEQKKNVCLNCNNEFFSEAMIDFNVESYNSAYKKIFDPITIEEIKKILEKYDIGKKPLSKILNWGEVTVIRYLNGQVPNKAHSDILKSILNSPFIMDTYLNKNKHNLSTLAYKKVKNKIKQMELEFNYSKIYIVSNYIINKMDDITPLILQKILYFIQGFSNHFIKYNIFDSDCEAWVNGPVYREIYDSYSRFQYKYIEESNIKNVKKSFTKYLTFDEINLIDAIIKNFGCYSSDILMQMTHLTEPWIKNRQGLKFDEISNNSINIQEINEYFESIIYNYKINNLDDISNYSLDLFNKIITNKYNK